jgi:hypothetical protein
MIQLCQKCKPSHLGAKDEGVALCSSNDGLGGDLCHRVCQWIFDDISYLRASYQCLDPATY